MLTNSILSEIQIKYFRQRVDQECFNFKKELSKKDKELELAGERQRKAE